MKKKILGGIEKLGEFDVVVMDELRDKYPDKFIKSGQMDWKWFESEVRPHFFVYVRHGKNSISFTLQDGPIKEVGVNGCQVDTILMAAKAIIEGFNSEYPCKENESAIKNIGQAIDDLSAREKDRVSRGVEGYNRE